MGDGENILWGVGRMITIQMPEWFIYLIAILVVLYIVDLIMRVVISGFKLLIMKQDRESKNDTG